MELRQTESDTIRTDRELETYIQTLKEIKRLSLLYYKDLLLPNKFSFNFRTCTLPELNRFIKDTLIYVSDPAGQEHLTRAGYSMRYANSGKNHPLDCDDKTHLIVSWLLLQNELLTKDLTMPYVIYIVVSGRGDRPHHVYPEITLPGVVKDYIIDSTYPRNVLGQSLFPEKYRRKFHLFNDL